MAAVAAVVRARKTGPPVGSMFYIQKRKLTVPPSTVAKLPAITRSTCKRRPAGAPELPPQHRYNQNQQVVLLLWREPALDVVTTVGVVVSWTLLPPGSELEGVPRRRACEIRKQRTEAQKPQVHHC